MRRYIAQSVDEVPVSCERGCVKLQIHSGIAWRQEAGNAAIGCRRLKWSRHDGEQTGVVLIDELPISLDRFVACSYIFRRRPMHLRDDSEMLECAGPVFLGVRGQIGIPVQFVDGKSLML